MLTYADVCRRMPTYADVCCLAGFPADTLYRYHYFLRAEAELLTYADVC